MFIFNIFMVSIFILVGIINGITPYYSRRGTPFGITVPGSYQKHPFIQKQKKNYLVYNIVLSAVLSTPIFFLSRLESIETQEMWSSLYFSIAVLLLVVISFILYLKCRKAIQSWKKENNISSDIKKERIIIDTRYHKELNAVSTLSIVVAQIIIVLITVGITLLFYESIPDEFPIHWNSQNIPDRIVEKSYLSVLMMPAIQLLLIPIMAFSHYSFIKSKQKLLSNYPQATSKQSKKFRRAWSVYFLISSITLQLLLMGTTFYSLFFTDDFGMGYMGILIGLFVFVIVGYSVFLVWKYGQGGEKLVFSEIEDFSQEVTEVDEEEYWKWGVFYYNPEDPAIFVEKRFGIGSTINMARWQSWACIGGLVLFCILVSLISVVMV